MRVETDESLYTTAAAEEKEVEEDGHEDREEGGEEDGEEGGERQCWYPGHDCLPGNDLNSETEYNPISVFP